MLWKKHFFPVEYSKQKKKKKQTQNNQLFNNRAESFTMGISLSW